jgi:hypothetical protein
MLILPVLVCKFIVDWKIEIEYRVKHLGADERRLKRADIIMVVSCVILMAIPFFIVVVNPIMAAYERYF